MIRVIILSRLIFVVIAAPLEDDKQSQIICYENESDGKGNYKFSFETSNGIFRNESGTVVNKGQPDQYIDVQGFISFTDADGKEQKFRYVAGKIGYEIYPIQQTNMVKGADLIFIACMVFTTFVMVPQICCLEEQIKKMAFNTNGLGTYSFEYETTSGTFRREDGGIISSPTGDYFLVRGEYGYIDPGGRLFSMKYVADSNGYHPVINDDDTRYNDRRII